MTITSDRGEATAVARSLVRLNQAFTQSKVLHSAVEVGVFELLADGPATEPQIRERLGLHPRLTPDFLDALVALDLLDREDGHYSNSAVSAAYLVPGLPDYLGGGAHRNAVHNYAMWGRLTEALRDGRQRPSGVADATGFEPIYQSREETLRFLNHMDANNSFVGPQLATVLDWSAYRSFVDVAGARGNVAAALVCEQPHLEGGVFDLPGLRGYFDEHMERRGTTGQVTFHEGSFFDDPLPETDVIIFGHALHDWSPEIRQMLLHKAYAALRPGGAVVVYDQMIDDDRREAYPLLISLNVRLVREGGSEYTGEEIRGWAAEAGFRFDSIVPIDTVGGDKVFIARKDA